MSSISPVEVPWAQILGRAAARPEPILIPEAAGRCVLVTGAGGFIGSEMVRALIRSGAARIVLLDICELHLFEIAAEMERCGYAERSVAVLGSVCDRALLDEVFGRYRLEVVIHAAALKHVPLMEVNPLAAIESNALATWCVAVSAEKFGARQMVLVSTDKAVAPRSIMGAAKRIAELVMLEPAHVRRTAVRLVNVIGSPGSVGPLFAEQIARGGPVTVTHPDARRYFVTLEETIALLGQAMSAGAGVLVPEPGDAMRITELAQRMIAASGREVAIAYTGERPGDKLDEALVSRTERLDGAATAGLRRVESLTAPNLEVLLTALEAAVAARDFRVALNVVCDLIPDYEPSAMVRGAAGQPVRAGR
ncbi:MAG TPA: polysaccharide biosynthesis protein [Acidobacteriaceae bacterium]|nr:polysaccharide biosynthesis protein [Acidobacteriaceae bacterium]